MRTASGEFAATPRSAAINADINANMGQGAPTPRTYAGRLDRARSGRGESLGDVTDTPGKRPLNPHARHLHRSYLPETPVARQ